ncbi:MAG: aminodeoxychorismate/anthranilate synthase component II [Deltaproteobacteria bacterium]|jgi:anthranilate synthase component 2|nr:aminodeoxychorismate/anthranilate synthase component II [Deltaproteobacteria bacterium]
MKVLIFDCRDSFTFNLVHLSREILRPEDSLEVVRHDRLDLEKIPEFDRIILSPGPGVPSETTNLLPLIRKFAPVKPILGVCLGHQALAQVFGARLINLKTVFHGLKSRVKLLRPTRLFSGLPGEIEAGRYHSWLVDEKYLPPELTVTARDSDGLIMGLGHKSFDIHGVQFHPESILTPSGPLILRNFLYKEAV